MLQGLRISPFRARPSAGAASIRPAQLLGPRALRARRIVAAAGDGDKQELAEVKKDAKKEKQIEEFVEAMQKGGISKGLAQEVVKKWDDAGVGGDPRELRKLFLRQSATPILGTALQTLIDAAATYSIFQSSLFFDVGPDFWGKGALVVILDVLAGYFAFGVLFDIATLTAILVTTAKMGTSIDSFYAALKKIAGEASPPTGISVLDKAQAAVNAIKVAQALDAIAKMLDSAGAGSKGQDTLSNLSALLTLSRSEKKDGFDPASLKMTEAEAADLALKFAQYDLNDDNRLDASEVRAMAGQLGIELSSEEAAIAIQAMDRNSDGLIEFSEWARWYAVRKGKVPA